MTGVFLSVPRYDWSAPLSHPSSCMLVNHGPSQQSSKEEYEPWKCGATARYYTSHTQTMLPQGSLCQDPAGNWTTWRPPDHRRDANFSGTVMSPVHQVWPKPSCKAQWNGEEDKADTGRGGKTTSGNGQAWSLPSLRGQWRTGKSGGNWLQNHLWCPNNPCGEGIDDDGIGYELAQFESPLLAGSCEILMPI